MWTTKQAFSFDNVAAGCFTVDRWKESSPQHVYCPHRTTHKCCLTVVTSWNGENLHNLISAFEMTEFLFINCLANTIPLNTLHSQLNYLLLPTSLEHLKCVCRVCHILFNYHWLSTNQSTNQSMPSVAQFKCITPNISFMEGIITTACKLPTLYNTQMSPLEMEKNETNLEMRNSILFLHCMAKSGTSHEINYLISLFSFIFLYIAALNLHNWSSS